MIISQLIISIIISVVCFIALFIGFFIATKTDEELKSGKKYFIYLQKTLFIMTIFFVLFEYGYMVFGFIAIILFSIFLFWSKKDFHKLIYLVMSFALFLSFFKLSIVVPSIIFLYGFPTGTLYYMKSKKLVGLLSEYYYFLVVMIVLIVINQFF